MSHRWYFFLAHRSRVNIPEQAFHLMITKLLTVCHVELHSVQIPTVMADSESLNTPLLAVQISSKNELLFIRDLSDLTIHILFDAWLTSMNVGSKCSIASNMCRHTPSWHFYLRCGSEETSSPSIICIVCHQVLRHASETGTSSMGKHFLRKAHITKLNELTELEVTELTSSMVNETARAILKRQTSGGSTIVHWQRKFIFNI